MSAGAHAFYHDLLALLLQKLSSVNFSRYLDRLSAAHAPIIAIGLIAFSFSRGWNDSSRGTWFTMAEGALCAIGIGYVATRKLNLVQAASQSRLLSILRSESALLQTFVLRWFVRANRLCGAPAATPLLIAPTARLVRGNQHVCNTDSGFVCFARIIEVIGPFLRLSRRLCKTGAFLFPIHRQRCVEGRIYRQVSGGMQCAFMLA